MGQPHMRTSAYCVWSMSALLYYVLDHTEIPMYPILYLLTGTMRFRSLNPKLYTLNRLGLLNPKLKLGLGDSRGCPKPLNPESSTLNP